MSFSVQNKLLKKAGGSTVGHVRVGDIKHLSIPVCELSEQRMIARSIAGIVRLIDAEERQLKHHTSMKTGLMQDLLTGKVPVKADEPEEIAHA
jgi:type I restriction enzyme S subunit